MWIRSGIESVVYFGQMSSFAAPIQNLAKVAVAMVLSAAVSFALVSCGGDSESDVPRQPDSGTADDVDNGSEATSDKDESGSDDSGSDDSGSDDSGSDDSGSDDSGSNNSGSDDLGSDSGADVANEGSQLGVDGIADVDSLRVVDGRVVGLISNSSAETSVYTVEWGAEDETGVQVGEGQFVVLALMPGVTVEVEDVSARMEAGATLEDPGLAIEAFNVRRIAAPETKAFDDVTLVSAEVAGDDAALVLEMTVDALNSSSEMSDYEIMIGFFEETGLRYSTESLMISGVDPEATVSETAVDGFFDADRFAEARVISVERSAVS